jgi:hypothetical protein
MACQSCVSVRAVPGALDMRVSLAAPTPVACSVSTPVSVRLYTNALDMRVITCVRDDPTEYLNDPLGDIVLGDAILG